MDRLVRGPTGPNRFEIFQNLLVLVRSEIWRVFWSWSGSVPGFEIFLGRGPVPAFEFFLGSGPVWSQVPNFPWIPD